MKIYIIQKLDIITKLKVKHNLGAEIKAIKGKVSGPLQNFHKMQVLK